MAMTRSAAAWDPAQYLRFADERLRPALDLLLRVTLEAPARVVDLGCGPGNVTAVLRQRFPAADVIGVDGSAAMLEKARAATPGCRFEQADFFQWRPDQSLDLIYSNAALQWVGEHAALFPRLLSFLAPGGVLAIQMPAMHDTPLRRVPYDIAASGPWAERLRGVTSAPGVLSAAAYWDVLRPHVASLDMWQTTYMHALAGENAVLEWTSGSSLRPFLDRLPDEQKAAFRQAYAEAVRPHYPRRADGATLLPFHRLFMVARKG
jgi:trans-aconitate 2-methyltransferase